MDEPRNPGHVKPGETGEPGELYSALYNLQLITQHRAPSEAQPVWQEFVPRMASSVRLYRRLWYSLDHMPFASFALKFQATHSAKIQMRSSFMPSTMRRKSGMGRLSSTVSNASHLPCV